MNAIETASRRLGDVISQTWAVLLDFDGPLTHLFIDGRSQRLADQLRTVLRAAGVTTPSQVEATKDPLEVLRWTALHTSESTREAVEAACIAGEYQCVDESDPTPGSRALLDACRYAGRPVVILSNNAPDPIRHHLDRHRLSELVYGVIGRTPHHPERMKPHPDSVERALALLNQSAGRCAFIGDSLTDIEVAHLTGLRSIGFAKNPRRGDELAAAKADTVVQNLSDIAAEIRSQHTAPADQPACRTDLY